MPIETGSEAPKGEEQKPKLSQEQLISTVLDLQKQLEDFKKIKAESQPQTPVGADFAESIAKAFLKYSKGDLDASKAVLAADIPKDDLLDVPIPFFAPCAGYFVQDDKTAGGLILAAPYNSMIEFEFLAVRRTGSGRAESTIPISRYLCRSKEIAKFLRSHSNYMVKFYESTQGISDERLKRAARTSEIISVVKEYAIDTLIDTCKQYGVPFSDNYAAMRGGLAMAMAEKEIQEELQISTRILEETHKTKLVTGKS